MKQSRSKVWWLVVSVLGSALGAAAYFGGWFRVARQRSRRRLRSRPVAKQPDPIAVTVAEAVSRPVERRVRTVGTLHGFEESTSGRWSMAMCARCYTMSATSCDPATRCSKSTTRTFAWR